MEIDNALNEIVKIKARDFANPKVVICDVADSVSEVAKRMATAPSSCCLVMERGKLVGIITERDLVRRVIALGKDPNKTKAIDVMSYPPITVDEDASVEDIAFIMSQYRIRKMPVVDKSGALKGLVTSSDLARLLAQRLQYANVFMNALARVKLELQIG